MFSSTCESAYSTRTSLKQNRNAITMQHLRISEWNMNCTDYGHLPNYELVMKSSNQFHNSHLV